MKSARAIPQEYPLNAALDYIENHLREPISPVRIAGYVGYSRVYLDQRFSAVTGESLASYLRKRRLSEAARELITLDKAILDIALDFQYQSAEAFTRAFYQAFHLTPSAYRKRKRLARFFSRIRIHHLQQLWRPADCGRLIYPPNSLSIFK